MFVLARVVKVQVVAKVREIDEAVIEGHVIAQLRVVGDFARGGACKGQGMGVGSIGQCKSQGLCLDARGKVQVAHFRVRLTDI